MANLIKWITKRIFVGLYPFCFLCCSCGGPSEKKLPANEESLWRYRHVEMALDSKIKDSNRKLTLPEIDTLKVILKEGSIFYLQDSLNNIWVTNKAVFDLGDMWGIDNELAARMEGKKW